MKVQIASYQNKKKFVKNSLKISENEKKHYWLKNLKKFCLSKFAYFGQYANFKSHDAKIFIPQKTASGMGPVLQSPVTVTVTVNSFYSWP